MPKLKCLFAFNSMPQNYRSPLTRQKGAACYGVVFKPEAGENGPGSELMRIAIAFAFLAGAIAASGPALAAPPALGDHAVLSREIAGEAVEIAAKRADVRRAKRYASKRYAKRRYDWSYYPYWRPYQYRYWQFYYPYGGPLF